MRVLPHSPLLPSLDSHHIWLCTAVIATLRLTVRLSGGDSHAGRDLIAKAIHAYYAIWSVTVDEASPV